MCGAERMHRISSTKWQPIAVSRSLSLVTYRIHYAVEWTFFPFGKCNEDRQTNYIFHPSIRSTLTRAHTHTYTRPRQQSAGSGTEINQIRAEYFSNGWKNKLDAFNLEKQIFRYFFGHCFSCNAPSGHRLCIYIVCRKFRQFMCIRPRIHWLDLMVLGQWMCLFRSSLLLLVSWIMETFVTLERNAHEIRISLSAF